MATDNFKHLFLASPGGNPYPQVGAVQQLQREIPAEKIIRITATSSATLIGLMLALNYRSDSIHQVYDQLYHPTAPMKPGLPRQKITPQQTAQENSHALKQMLKHVIANRYPQGENLTFRQLAEMRGHVDISFTAQRHHPVGAQTLLYSRQYTPDTRIADAALAAAATPNIFMPYIDEQKIVFTDGGYVTDPANTDIISNPNDTLSILNCSGSETYIPYLSDPRRILLNQGKPAEKNPLHATAEQIYDMLKMGMNSVADYLHPQQLLAQSHKIAQRFNTNSTAAGLRRFGMFNAAKIPALAPVVTPVPNNIIRFKK